MEKFAKIKGLRRGYSYRVLQKLEEKKVYVSVSLIYKVASGHKQNPVVRLALMDDLIESLEEQKLMREKLKRIALLTKELNNEKIKERKRATCT